MRGARGAKRVNLPLFSFVCTGYSRGATCDAAGEKPGVVMPARRTSGPGPGPLGTSEPLLCSIDLRDLQTPSRCRAQDHTELWPAHGKWTGARLAVGPIAVKPCAPKLPYSSV